MSLKFASDMSEIFCFGRMKKTPFAVATVFLVLCFSLELQGNVGELYFMLMLFVYMLSLC